MRSLCLAALIAVAFPSIASAADVSTDAGLVSDYRFRGISLSDGQPALQASLTVEDDTGLYAGAWGSTIKEGGSELETELQLFAGYELPVSGRFSIDLSANYYAYAADWNSNYLEATAIARLAAGKASVGLGYSFVPKQSGTRDELGRHSNSYVFAEAAYEIPDRPLKLSGSIGYERGFFDEVEGGGKWDWTVGVEITASPARAGIAYVGSNAPGHDDGLVASLFVDF